MDTQLRAVCRDAAPPLVLQVEEGIGGLLFRDYATVECYRLSLIVGAVSRPCCAFGSGLKVKSVGGWRSAGPSKCRPRAPTCVSA